MTDSPPSERSGSPAATQQLCRDATDERGTPPEFVRTLADGLGQPFDLDPCSGAEQEPLAKARFTAEDNGLAQPWDSAQTVFVNPPYSDLTAWLQKIVYEANRNGKPDIIVGLLPGNTSTQWFHQYAAEASYLVPIEGRLEFTGTDGSAPFASILIVFGDPPDEFVATLDTLGTVYTREHTTECSDQARIEDFLSQDGGFAANMPRTLQAGVEMYDTSSHAPAVPQGVFDFTNLRRGERIRITPETGSLGCPSAVPDVTDAYVETIQLPNARDPAESRAPHIDTGVSVLAVAPESETYFCLRQDQTILTDVQCSVAPEGGRWYDIPLRRLVRRGSVCRPQPTQPSDHARTV